MMRAIGWIFGLVGFFVLLVYGAAWAVFSPEVPQWAHVVGATGALMIGLWLFLDWGSLKNLGRDQTVARSATAGFAALMALAVCIAANVVSNKYEKRWDFTENKRYTLSQQSIDITTKLDREVEVLAFFQNGTPQESNFRALADNYTQHSTLLKIEFHDPFGDPLLAEQMKVMSASGTVILKSGENTQRLESEFDEEAFTNALVKVTSDVQHPVCAVSGHGELDPEQGMAQAKVKIEGQNYKFSTISLLQGAPSPDECKVLLVASPSVDLLPAERDRLAQYVAGGGNLIVLLDPLQTPETAADMARYGVAVGQDVVIDPDPNRQLQGGNPTWIALDESSWAAHPITSKLSGLAIFRLARSVAKGPEVPGLLVQELVFASESSWGETALADTAAEPAPNPETEKVGKVPMMVAVEVSDPAAIRTDTPASAEANPAIAVAAVTPSPAPPAKAGGKVVVVGDSDFISDEMLLAGVNQDVFLNTIAWMVGEEDQISIRANEAGKGKLSLTLVSMFLSAAITLVAAPGLAIAGAVGTWLYRRRL